MSLENFLALLKLLLFSLLASKFHLFDCWCLWEENLRKQIKNGDAFRKQQLQQTKEIVYGLKVWNWNKIIIA